MRGGGDTSPRIHHRRKDTIHSTEDTEDLSHSFVVTRNLLRPVNDMCYSATRNLPKSGETSTKTERRNSSGLPSSYNCCGAVRYQISKLMLVLMHDLLRRYSAMHTNRTYQDVLRSYGMTNQQHSSSISYIKEMDATTDSRERSPWAGETRVRKKHMSSVFKTALLRSLDLLQTSTRK